MTPTSRLYSARPGTWQRMPSISTPARISAPASLDQVLALTHGDRYKALSGYQVMNHHYHMDLGQRLACRRQPRRRDSRSAGSQVALASPSSARSTRSWRAAAGAPRAPTRSR